jgi:competence protein ComEA
MKKRKWIISILTVAFIMLAGILYSCRRADNNETQVSLQSQEADLLPKDAQVTPEDVQATQEDSIVQVESQNSTAYIYVHLCGAVKSPNVYKVADSARLIDVIEEAGGLTKDAAGDYVNQAALVTDGQRIYIPTKKEVEDLTPIDYDESDSAVSENDAKQSDKVNINTADMEQLMTLTGIGEAKAKSIITYREDHNGFKSIEEIKNINGIKDSVFQKISDVITVK